MFLKRRAINNARNSRLSLYNNQQSQQSISSSSESSLSLSSSNVRRPSNITSIPENIETEIIHPVSFEEHDDSGKIHMLRKSASSRSFKKVQDMRRHSVGAIYIEQKTSDPCCDPKIIKKLNELSPETYEIVKCSKAQNYKTKWYFNIFNKFKKFKVRCHKGQKSHIVTAKCIKNGKMVIVKRVEKKNLTNLDYYKPACYAVANCGCTECDISKLQSSSIFSTGSSNPTILSAIITFNEESIIKTATVDSIEKISLQNFDSTQNSPQTSILNNSSQHSLVICNNSTNSPRTSICNIQTQCNNNSPRASIYSHIQFQYNNNSPRTSVNNIQSQPSVRNNLSRYNALNPVGITPIVLQIDKLKKESNALSSSSSISISCAVESSHSQSSPALSIKSDSSSMSVQPPSEIHSYIPIELHCLQHKVNEFPAYIDNFDDGRYIYYVTKFHGVKQRKLKKPSSWFKKKYFEVNWDEYLNS
ncbi:hypothetical protein RclHR1_04630003 [Rhizophagus clarus]|uniref:Uncharacterized protein n=1 Tax=Rhizophagus clarus TaxID=94130 RepID=A0A2Z6SC44_9GLOM|nr:hypothetical protein RclHR1_04630003 [Rhizophagus clarus]GET00343.1 hypothetical protein GLOIN_2v1772100 [Rhizophagus clarus]